MSEIEKLLRELIALPSVNPAFLPEGHPWAGEKRVAEFLAVTAARAGLEVEFQPVRPNRSNLLVRLLPSGKVRRRIVLAPHLDTVGGSEKQFVPRKAGGRIYGRGASDTKGSVAAMMGALCDLARKGSRARSTEIVFAGLVDEENGQLGSRALVSSGLEADLAIVGEPTELRVVTAHKGDLWMELETRGKAAHGSQPELGRNAVHEMARVVDFLETKYAAELRKRRHSLLGCATVSVGKITGGVQANIVPDYCSIVIDRRTLPGETEAGVRREILARLRRQGLKATIRETSQAACRPFETNPRLPLVAAFLESVGQDQPAGVHFFCDASVLARGGIPSVVFGPGNIAQGHTADEWIEVGSLEQAGRMLRGFIQCLMTNDK